MFYFIALGLFMIMKQNSSVMIVQEQQEQEY
jgi:hypothetical protein